ncbi:MAG TPA: NADH-quinone oxidoreductase subunit C [Gemmatimonadales bacterium]
MIDGSASPIDPVVDGRSPAATVALDDVTAPSTVAALRARFPTAVIRSLVVSGQTVVYIHAAQSHAVLDWLQTGPLQRFDYLTDITCVEYRDAELPLEVVYQLRSLGRRADLRVKLQLDPDARLEVASVIDLWAGADWLEREAYDMFGVVFKGHPDLRRILMWEGYAEGYPLRKAFPLRGHWSRAEQTRQALQSNPEAYYSLEELSIADAYHELPQDVKDRLAASGRVLP